MSSTQELITALTAALADPQKSERWAMYRLVTPTVDHAAAPTGWRVFFELDQTSDHQTRQSVDIALLDGERPMVLIEAKAVRKDINPDMVAKYLSPGMRGVVTNGCMWLLCLDGQHLPVALCDVSPAGVDGDAMATIVRFIRGEAVVAGGWRDEPQTYRSKVKVAAPRKAQRAVRKSHPSEGIGTASDLQAFLERDSTRPPAEVDFLRAWVDAIRAGGLPSGLHIEARKSRVVFFHQGPKGKGQRIARIQLGTRNPDILIRTEVVAAHPELAELSPPQIHDKGAHMRRFRLVDAATSAAFGGAMASALRAVVSG